MSEFPSLFISHGAPLLAIQDGPAHRFLRGLGTQLGRPAAIVIASAHWETDAPLVTTSAMPPTIHDFSGFPPELHQMLYPAPGDPALGEHVHELLATAFPDAHVDPVRGLDHGAWVPLALMYPDAGIPVLQVSIQTERGADHHLKLGAALAPLRSEGVLLIGSGSATHNLRDVRGFNDQAPTAAYVTTFTDWLSAVIEGGRTDDLVHYLERGPDAGRSHPTAEHFLPLLVACGMGGPGVPARRIHSSVTFGVVAMDIFAFGERTWCSP